MFKKTFFFSSKNIQRVQQLLMKHVNMKLLVCETQEKHPGGTWSDFWSTTAVKEPESQKGSLQRLVHFSK